MGVNKKSPMKPIFDTLIRGKGIFDGSRSIRDMIRRLQEVSEQLEKLDRAGIRLERRITDDYATLVTHDAKVAKRHGLMERVP